MATKQLLTLTVVRKACGLSQRELAEAIGLFQPDVSEWENGKPIPYVYAKAIRGYLRKKNRKAVLHVHPTDLSLPWDEVLLRIVREPQHSAEALEKREEEQS